MCANWPSLSRCDSYQMVLDMDIKYKWRILPFQWIISLAIWSYHVSLLLGYKCSYTKLFIAISNFEDSNSLNQIHIFRTNEISWFLGYISIVYKQYVSKCSRVGCQPLTTTIRSSSIDSNFAGNEIWVVYPVTSLLWMNWQKKVIHDD